MTRWLHKIKATMLYKKALQLVKKELFHEASDILKKASKLNPESAQILVVLGYSYLRIADEFKEDEESMNSWVNKAADISWKAIENHRKYGGLNQTQINEATDLVASVDRINMKNDQNLEVFTRMEIFKIFKINSHRSDDWQAGAWDAIAYGTDLADMMRRREKPARPMAQPERKVKQELINSYKITERQLNAIIQEGENEGW